MSFGENDISREARVRIQGNQFKGPESDHFGVHVTAAGQEALEQAERLLEGIPNGIERALSGAIRRATAHMQSVSKKAVRERYAISAANIRAEESVTVAYTYQNGVQAYVHFAGNRIPLYRFDGARPAQPTYDTSRLVPVMLGTDADGEGKWRMVHPGAAASFGDILGDKLMNKVLALRGLLPGGGFDLVRHGLLSSFVNGAILHQNTRPCKYFLKTLVPT